MKASKQSKLQQPLAPHSPNSSQKDSGGTLSQKQLATPQSSSRTRGQSKRLQLDGLVLGGTQSGPLEVSPSVEGQSDAPRILTTPTAASAGKRTRVPKIQPPLLTISFEPPGAHDQAAKKESMQVQAAHGSSSTTQMGDGERSLISQPQEVGHHDKEEKKLSEDEDGDLQHIDDLEEAADGEEDELELMLKMEGIDDEDDGNHSKVVKGTDGEVLGSDVSLSAPATLKEAEPIVWNKTITDKEFYKAMQKLKDRGTNAVPPKKSASAYIIFGKEKRAEILKRSPMARVTEVVKEIAKSWKLLTKEDRQRYKEAAKRDKERYEKELRSLESHSNLLKKPKKCLSAYMIFVKETRPLIVDTHPEMGALQVMQEVGKKWQAMTAEERLYFKQKADRDKVRYLTEQRAFYDEVEQIGKNVGTITTKEGKIIVAPSITMDQALTTKEVKKSLKEKHLGGESDIGPNAESELGKRKNATNNISHTTMMAENSMLDSPQKRVKAGDEFVIQPQLPPHSSLGLNDPMKMQQMMYPTGNQPQMPISNQFLPQQPWQGFMSQISNTSVLNPTMNQMTPMQSQQSQQADSHLKPKKPLSSFIYFSQEFRDLIRQRFSFLSSSQMTRVVTYRWRLLTKEQKLPFEQIASEDKQRYYSELALLKKGEFTGRSLLTAATGKAATRTEGEAANSAMEINDSLMRFIQENCQQSNVNESNPEDLPEGLNEDDYEALKEAEKVENGNKMTMEPGKTDGNHEAYITQPNMHPEANNMINAPMMPAMDSNFQQPYNPMMMSGHSGYPPIQPSLYNPYGYQMPPPVMVPPSHMPQPSFIDQINKYQLGGQVAPQSLPPQVPHSSLQFALSSALAPQQMGGPHYGGGVYGGNGGFDSSQRNFLQEQLQNRDQDRKLSINFGQGGFSSYFPSVNNNYGQSPALHHNIGNHSIIGDSPMMQMSNPYGPGGLASEDHGNNYFMGSGGPFQLPPSNIQGHSGWAQPSSANSSFLKPQPMFLPPQAIQSNRKISSPQLNPANALNPQSSLDVNPPPVSLMHTMSFSNTGLFKQQSSGSLTLQEAQQQAQQSSISPFLGASQAPPMLYPSPSFGAAPPGGNNHFSQMPPPSGGSNPFLIRNRNNSLHLQDPSPQ